MPQAPRLWPAVPVSRSVSAPSAQRVGAEAAHDLAREQRADRAVGVVHGALDRDLLAARERVAGQREHLAVERRGGRRARDAARSARSAPSGPTAGASSAPRSMPAPPSRDLARQVGAADELVEAPHAELRP